MLEGPVRAVLRRSCAFKMRLFPAPKSPSWCSSVQGSLDVPAVATQLRRLFDPRGGPARKDVLAVRDRYMESEGGDLSYGAWAAFREAKKRRKDASRGPSSSSEEANKVKGGGQMLNSPGRRTGERNRCYTCGSEHHLAPSCPQRKQWKPVSTSSPPSVNKAPRSTFSSFSMDNSASVCMEGSRAPKDKNGNCEQPFPTTLEAGGQ